MTSIPGNSKRLNATLRWTLAICLTAAIISGIVIGRISPDALILGSERLIAEARDLGWAGVLFFAGFQLLVTLSGVFPASLAAVAAGMVYGFFPGLGISILTTLGGAYLAFRLSRSMFRPSVHRFISRYRTLENLDELVSADGWKLVFLLRISPIMPFSATSYMLGLSKIDARSYLIGTLASLPALAGYVSMGALTKAGLSSWVRGDSPFRWLLIVAGGLALIVLALWMVQTAFKLRLTREAGMRPSA